MDYYSTHFFHLKFSIEWHVTLTLFLYLKSTKIQRCAQPNHFFFARHLLLAYHPKQIFKAHVPFLHPCLSPTFRTIISQSKGEFDLSWPNQNKNNKLSRSRRESLLYAVTFSLGSFGVFVLSTVSFSLPQPAEVAGKAFLRSILC